MNDQKKVALFFDDFQFPVSYGDLKDFITDELNRLSKETGYRMDHLKLEFKENFKDDVVAYFQRAGDQPIGFCFFLNKFQNTSPNKIADTCRHEFSHFVVCMKNAGHQPADAHGTQWKKVCGTLGAKPSPVMNHLPTRHIVK